MRTRLFGVFLGAPLLIWYGIDVLQLADIVSALLHGISVLLLLGIQAFLAWQSSSRANLYTQTRQAVADLVGDLIHYSVSLATALAMLALPCLAGDALPRSGYWVYLIYYALLAALTGYELYLSAANGFESLRKTSEISISSR